MSGVGAVDHCDMPRCAHGGPRGIRVAPADPDHRARAQWRVAAHLGRLEQDAVDAQRGVDELGSSRRRRQVRTELFEGVSVPELDVVQRSNRDLHRPRLEARGDDMARGPWRC